MRKKSFVSMLTLLMALSMLLAVPVAAQEGFSDDPDQTTEQSLENSLSDSVSTYSDSVPAPLSIEFPAGTVISDASRLTLGAVTDLYVYTNNPDPNSYVSLWWYSENDDFFSVAVGNNGSGLYTGQLYFYSESNGYATPSDGVYYLRYIDIVASDYSYAYEYGDTLPMPEQFAGLSVTFNLSGTIVDPGPEPVPDAEAVAGTLKAVGGTSSTDVYDLTNQQHRFGFVVHLDVVEATGATLYWRNQDDPDVVNTSIMLQYGDTQLRGDVPLDPGAYTNGRYVLERLVLNTPYGPAKEYSGAELQALYENGEEIAFTTTGSSAIITTPGSSLLAEKARQAVEQAKQSGETVTITVNAADGGSTVIPAAAFDVIAGENVQFSIQTRSGYTLVFKGKDVYAGLGIDVDVDLRQENARNLSFIPDDDNFTRLLVFPNNGILPGKAELLIPYYADEMPVGKLYYEYEPGRYILEQDNIMADGNVYRVPIIHNSNFLFTDLEIADNPGGGGGGGSSNDGSKTNPKTGM